MSVRSWHVHRSDRQDESGSAPPAVDGGGPTLLGFPAEYAADDDPPDGPPGVHLVVLRRADPVAAAALVLAGVATAVSLWVPWLRGESTIGLVVVQRGLREAGTGLDRLVAGSLWPPLAVVLGGGVLLVLGLLLVRPARTHRLVGVLELFVAVLVAAGVLVLLAGTGWHPAAFGVGAWCAVAVAVFGLLGALKAVLTTPRVVLEREGRPVPPR